MKDHLSFSDYEEIRRYLYQKGDKILRHCTLPYFKGLTTIPVIPPPFLFYCRSDLRRTRCFWIPSLPIPLLDKCPHGTLQFAITTQSKNG